METLYDKASLILNPGIYDTGKVYCTKPLDGSGDLTFTRASNATRVNSSGYIEKAKVNLLLQSNSFDTTWVKAASFTLTSGQSGYDGTSNAWKLESDGASGYDAVYQSITISGVNTYSIYAKAGTNTNFALRSLSATDARANFDLSAGSLSTSGTIDASIVSVGGDWYRCSITFNGSNNAVYIYPNTLGSASAGFVYIQDAQLNYGLVAQEYQETTTTSVVSGITNDMPRLDYSGGASCPSLLLEPQRSNLLPYSEYISGWSSKSAVYHTNGANATTSPEGLSNGWKITGDGTSGQHYVLQSANYTSGTAYTCSIFAKADTNNYIQLILGAAPFGSANYCNFDLSDGSIGTIGPAISDEFIEDYGDGWYRIGFSATAVSTGSGNFFPALVTSSSATFFESNSTTGSVFLYGGMVEQGSYPTSYIPTYGTSATRTADACSKTGISSLIGQTEGTLFVDMNYTNTNNSVDATPFRVLGSGSAQMYVEINTNETFEAVVVNSVGTLVFNSTSAAQVAGRKKMAIAYKGSDFAYYINGTQIAVQTSGAFASASLDSLNLGMYTSGVQVLADSVNQTLVFKTRLTNAQLAELTTL
jgi:hypothetical protein